jgi:hypothetical protein
MKVKVTYTTTITEVVEVNDKFSVLSINDPGYDSLTYCEEINLMDELLGEGADQVGCCVCDICDICDAETDEILAEV